jgi:hypothetical protein
MAKTKKICEFCKQPYKVRAEVRVLFGTKICLHDEYYENFMGLAGQPVRNNPALTVKVAKEGHTKTEAKYIEKAQRAGDVVLRGSDGQLRRVGK